MKHVWILHNPCAGGGAAHKSQNEDLLLEKLSALRAQGWTPRLFAPDSAAAIPGIVRESAQCGVREWIVCGGDGTFHEAARAVMALSPEIRPTLTLIPLGTGSDTVRSLCARPDALETEAQLRDVVEVEWADPSREKEIVLNLAGFGLSPRVVLEKEKNPAWLPKGLAYLLPTVRALPFIQSESVQFKTVEGEQFAGQAVAWFAGKGAFAGAGMRLGVQGIAGDSGMFGVLVIEARAPLRLFRSLPRLYQQGWGEQEADSGVRVFHTREVVFSAPQPACVELDGEYRAGAVSKIRIVPKALRIR